jgi:type II secretory pathway component GspD/PulD (secretin)
VALRWWDQDGKKLDTMIRLLNSRGRARVLSSPNLVVAPGEEASIITGEEVPVQSSTISGGSTTIATQFKRVGIKLRVSLLQLTNDTARLELNPEVSTVTGFTAAAAGQPANPIIAIRNVTSTLTLKGRRDADGGGLLRNEKRRTTRGIPVLEDVPRGRAAVPEPPRQHGADATHLLPARANHQLGRGRSDPRPPARRGAGSARPGDGV